MASTSLRFGDVTVTVDDYHGDFLILRSDVLGALGRIGKALFERQFHFVDEVIVSQSELLLKLNARYSPQLLPTLAAVGVPAASAAKTFVLPVLLGDSPDWEAVLAATGHDRDSLSRELERLVFSVAMLGFLPGFVYLEGLPEGLHLPRKADPAKYVEAGSLAIGGPYLGLYALDSPGGWHVIGKTPLRLLEVPDLPPVPYAPGDQFRIRAIGHKEFDRLAARSLTLSQYHADT